MLDGGRIAVFAMIGGNNFGFIPVLYKAVAHKLLAQAGTYENQFNAGLHSGPLNRLNKGLNGGSSQQGGRNHWRDRSEFWDGPALRWLR